MKNTIPDFCLRILIVCQLLLLGGCSTSLSSILGSGERSPSPGIQYYELSFEIDPAKGIFLSRQRITISADLAQGDHLSIFVGKDLVIDTLRLEDEAGNELDITEWGPVDSYRLDYFWGTAEFSEIEIVAGRNIPNTGNLVVYLEYHLPAEAIRVGLPENLYSLFVSPQGAHAGGPESGAFAQVSGKLEAPFTISIRHPEGFQCALPGERVISEEIDGYVSVTYRSETPYDPSFSCAPYNVMSKTIEGMRVEIFHPAQYHLSPDMLDTAARVLQVYQQKFGKTKAESFRIVFPDLGGSEAGGESNGNLILLGYIRTFLDYDEGENAREAFVQLIAHEGYHLWNTWGLDWEGDYSEWWVEGGANFMASWVKEMLLGTESGEQSRLEYLETYNEQEAYLHSHSLSNLDEGWFEDWALVYNYGALVWEQLRQAVGSDALTAGLRDFYEIHADRTVGYDDLISALEDHTEVDVDSFLDQWTRQNAKIDLAISKVTIQDVDGKYEVQVDVPIDADRDYELFTTLGYRSTNQGSWQLVRLHLEHSKHYIVKFETDERPLEIRIDPEYRVPQIGLDNNLWLEPDGEDSGN